MTYITYEKAQYQVGIIEEGTRGLKDCELFREPLRKIPAVLPKPSFMPSYLVRTSDMKVVPGSKVHEGYCTLSYSWNQSGEVIKDETTGKSHRIDQGKHEIIFPDQELGESLETPVPDDVTFVTFEGLIQEICKDFNIKYIWYDQMCINQNNEQEKHQEIHQMHNIYNSAYCTLALIPELSTEAYVPMYTEDGMIFEDEHLFLRVEWMKRMWTLEEAVMSPKMLFVGRNFHCWSEQLRNPIFHNKSSYDATTILHYAHTRTSTKEHDHIFALANIFPDIIREIKVDYNQDIQELMIQFYGLLAKKDLSILCFESGTSLSGRSDLHLRWEATYKRNIQKFDLPSWTGVNGQHLVEGILKTPLENYTVSGGVLEITCRGVMNREHRILDLESIENLIPPLPLEQNFSLYRSTALVLEIPDTEDNRIIQVYEMLANPAFTEYDVNKVKEALRIFSYFFPIEKMNLQWRPHCRDFSNPWFKFSDLTEPFENSAQYVLLSGLKFTNGRSFRRQRYPVLKKDGDYYKAIGMCEMGNGDDHLFDDIALEEQTFKIC